MLNKITDSVGYNIYYGWYYGKMSDNKEFLDSFHKDNPSVCLGITEYGVDCNTAFHSSNPTVRDYTEDYQALYHETVYPYFKSAEYLFGTFIWNLYDFSSEIRDEGGIKYQNTKGIITRNHIKKDAFYYYKSQWSKEPFVEIAQKRFKNRDTDSITVKVYSNEKTVNLSINESELITLNSNTGVFLFENIYLNPGVNKINVTAADQTDSAEFIKVDKIDESYVFKDSSVGINVKNWFTDLVEEEKLFPKDRYSIRDGADIIVESKEAMAVIDECAPKLGMALRARSGAMSLERILSHMKGLLTDEDSRVLNKKLTEIKK